MPVGPNRNTQVQKIYLQIDEVDLANRVVHGRDKTNVLIVASFKSTPAGILAVPKQSERWIATRIGMGHWNLESRLDSADEQAWAEENLNPGDTRIPGERVFMDSLVITNLPTSDPHVSGALWNSGGVIHISP